MGLYYSYRVRCCLLDVPQIVNNCIASTVYSCFHCLNSNTMSDCDSSTEVDQVADLEEPILLRPNYQKYFKVLRVIEENFFYKKLKVKCLSCVDTKCYKVDSRSNSNKRKHSSIQHSTLLKKIDHIDNAANKNTLKRCNDGSLKYNVGSSLKQTDKNNQTKQPVLEDFLNNKKLTSQS
ncbi:uncharacterized protein LOC111028041 [Myzus persicae]|uniref:uncharacterized protein LOC111028041 n=1 Tax=Myzus persicae TaxID=13164 RepID=UPI000B9343AD|nr:uncharacterized protein LOC111028041 [Myzus persicae]